MHQPAAANPSAADNFDRPDGPLGGNWSPISDGAMTISSHAATGTSRHLSAGIWTADLFTSDQFSKVKVLSTPLTGGQWVGPAVRVQRSGQDAYVGTYYWNNGHPELILFMRKHGVWTQIGAARDTGPLPTGAQLQLEAIGSAIYFFENGVLVVSASNSGITGGAPGIMAFGGAGAGDWSGGDEKIPRFQATYTGTGTNGIESYQVFSSDDGSGPEVVRVLRPTRPARGIPHNFLYVLPVEPGLADTFGDPVQTILRLNAQNQYNLTIIEPTFATDPWYANNPSSPGIEYENFISQLLVPWAQRNLATTGTEQNWLIGFSKSGFGAQDLILKHPGTFSLAASWDFPADMSSDRQFGDDSAAGYGTDKNFQVGYRLTRAFLTAHKTPFLQANRIWVGGYSLYQTDVEDYEALLTAVGITHTTGTPEYMTHVWSTAWIRPALAALHRDSIALSGRSGSASS